MKINTIQTEIIEQNPGVIGMLQHIEKCGRICYKSTSDLTKETAIDFVSRMIKSGHGTTLEHGTVYMKITINNIDDNITYDDIIFYLHNHYSYVVQSSENNTIDVNTYYITTNFRVLVENNRIDDIEKYGCKCTKYHIQRYTFQFTCDIGVSREFNRHRVHSANEESTRYCNYLKDRFGSEIKYTLPVWLENKIEEINDKLEEYDFYDYCSLIADKKEMLQFDSIDYWLFGLMSAEWCYNNLIKSGWKAQQARQVLNLNTQTTLIHTATFDEWQRFFKLRVDGSTGAPHPNAKRSASQAKELLDSNIKGSD